MFKFTKTLGYSVGTDRESTTVDSARQGGCGMPDICDMERLLSGTLRISVPSLLAYSCFIYYIWISTRTEPNFDLNFNIVGDF